MPHNIDGAGRSRSLACLPTARGTVAPTRGQVPGEFSSGPVLVPEKVNTLNFSVQAVRVAVVFSR